jgi:hypothetical protein
MTGNRISVLALLILLLLGCQRGQLQQQNNNNAVASPTTTLNDADLIKLIQKFEEDQGEEGQKAFAQLSSLPRGELISSLSRLRNSLSSTDSLQPQIAFVLCYLNQDYKTNVEIVASALSKKPKYQNFFADSAASLVDRLIERGDKSLLKNLFSTVLWSDGALSEQLGVSFGNELSHDTPRFVEMLADQPIAVRTRVYELINETGSLSREEIELVKTALRHIGAKSTAHLVAQEMLKSVALRE